MSIDFKALSNEVADLIAAQEQRTQKREFKQVPVGTYDVKINKMDIRRDKNDEPTFFVSFKVLNGEFKDEYIPYFQKITLAFQLKIMVDFLRDLKSGVDINVKEYDLSDYELLVFNIFNAVKDVYEFKLDYSLNEKGYKKYKIVEVSVVETDDLPF